MGNVSGDQQSVKSLTASRIYVSSGKNLFAISGAVEEMQPLASAVSYSSHVPEMPMHSLTRVSIERN